MKRCLFSVVLIILGGVFDGPRCDAAVVNITGEIQPGSGMHGGAGPASLYTFNAAFNTVGSSGVVGAITAATFTIAGQSYGLTVGSVSIFNNPTGDILNFNLNLDPSGGFAGGNLSVRLFSSPGDTSIVSDQLLTQTNVAALVNNTNDGSLTWRPVTGTTLNGSVTSRSIVAAVPEPASIITMAGVGMFFVGGAVRRRRKRNADQLEAVAV